MFRWSTYIYLWTCSGIDPLYNNYSELLKSERLPHIYDIKLGTNITEYIQKGMFKLCWIIEHNEYL